MRGFLAGDGVGAQQLAQLDLQLQRRERRDEPVVGAGGRDVAGRRSALCSTSSSTFASRVTASARSAATTSRAGWPGAFQSRMTRSGRLSRTVSSSDSPGGASSTSTRLPTATRVTARVLGSTPGEQHARARAPPRRARRPSRRSCPSTGCRRSAGTRPRGRRGRHVEVVAERGHRPRRRGVGERPGRVDHRARGGHQVGAGLEAPLGRLLERLRDHRVEAAGQLRAAGRQPRRVLGQVRVDHRDVGVARERQLAGQAVVEQAAERVDVGARVDPAALDLLGRDVVDRADHVAGLRQLRLSPRCASSGRSRSGTRCAPRSGRSPA